MAEEAIIISVRKYLNYLKENGFNISFGILYGSQATGKATEFSDIDLIVVSPDFEMKSNAKRLTSSGSLRDEPITESSQFPAALNDGKKMTTRPSST